MTNEVFFYRNSEITFRKESDSLMVNATNMSRPFGSAKRAKNWLSLASTREYLDIISKGRNLPLDVLVTVTKGGSNPGTWMQEDVALEFARWLSPEFGFWCNCKVQELLVKGTTTLTDNERQILLGAKTEVIFLKARISEMQPMNNFASAILSDGQSVRVNEMAAILTQNGCSISQNKLFEFLRDAGYIYSRRGRKHNMPMRKHLKSGIFNLRYPAVKGIDLGNKQIIFRPVLHITPHGIHHFLGHIEMIQAYLEFDSLRHRS